MVPSTPTPLPDPGAPPLTMPNMGVWEMSDSAIQFWNLFGDAVVIIQAVILLFIIGGVLMIIYRHAKGISLDSDG